MSTSELVDRFGRVARDLRVSLTDRCNLRCTYCMPAEGLDWIPTPAVLDDEEMLRVIRIAVDLLGIDHVRFTGGEPLLRPGLEDIIAATAQLENRPELALTTNGLGLDKRVKRLAAAGLDRVNVSLDSLDRERYARLTRRDRLGDVLKSLEAAEEAGLTPVKVNAVIMRGVNESEVVPLATFCLQRGYELRFIEQMPLGPRHTWVREGMVTAEEILAMLRSELTITPSEEPRGSAPAKLWDVAPGADHPGGRVGVIASVTHPFCGDCDRTRITADGQLRTCLFARTETDVRDILRNGGSDEDIVAAWTGAHRNKPRAHGIDDEGFVSPDRLMGAIGG